MNNSTIDWSGDSWNVYNYTLKNNQSNADPAPDWRKISLVILFASIFIGGLIGNLTTVVVLSINRTNFGFTILISLAITAFVDFLHLSACVPDVILSLGLARFDWLRLQCEFTRYLQVLALYSSVTVQLFVCVER